MINQRRDDADIIILEDSAALAIAAVAVFADQHDRLACCGMTGITEVCGNLRLLRKHLVRAQPGSVRLLLLDYAVHGGLTTDLLPELVDDQGKVAHPALHPACLILGWSAHTNVSSKFFASKAGGFISKQRPLGQLIDDLCFVCRRRGEGVSWVELT